MFMKQQQYGIKKTAKFTVCDVNKKTINKVVYIL